MTQPFFLTEDWKEKNRLAFIEAEKNCKMLDEKYINEKRLTDPNFTIPFIPGTTLLDNPYYMNGPARKEMGLSPLNPSFKM